MLEKKYLVGAAIGVTSTVTALYLYHKNKDAVNDFLSKHGIDVPSGAGDDYSSMSLEELVSTKEHIEDLLAEREQAVAETEA